MKTIMGQIMNKVMAVETIAGDVVVEEATEAVRMVVADVTRNLVAAAQKKESVAGMIKIGHFVLI